MLAAKRTTRKKAARRSGRIILVIGGAASGKSEVARQLAGTAAPRAFVATGQALDQEMAARIRRHQQRRSSDWETAEVPLELGAWCARDGHRYRTIVLDCITLWLSNLTGSSVSEVNITKRVEQLLDAMRGTGARTVIVSNELGLGLVPAEPSTRLFRDVAGRVNQQIAAEADEVHMVFSGIPTRIK
jgi:adenosylcobinamide kinase/adenosylcobinamide-phosphate guanylyltransferase